MKVKRCAENAPKAFGALGELTALLQTPVLDLKSKDRDKGRGRVRGRERRGDDKGEGCQGKERRGGREGRVRQEDGKGEDWRRCREGGISPPRSFLKVGAYDSYRHCTTNISFSLCILHLVL